VDAIQTALNSVIPTFLLIFIGALADRLFPKLDLASLTKLSIYFLIPALILNALAKTKLSFADAGLLSLAYILYLLVLGAIAYFATKGQTKTVAGAIIVSSLFGNTGNMGLPISQFAYGEAGLERAVVLLVVSLIIMFVVGPTVLSGKTDSIRKRFIAAIKLPPIWASLIGIGINILNIPIPQSIDRSINLLGSGAIPILLISLGIQMKRSWTWKIDGSALATTGLRLLIGPVVAYLIARLLGLANLDIKILVLSATMPAAVTMFIVALEVKGAYETVAKSVVATTIASIFALSAIIYIMNSFLM